MSGLRHGAGASDTQRGRGPQSGIYRYEAAVLGGSPFRDSRGDFDVRQIFFSECDSDPFIPMSVSNWIRLALSTPVVFWAGWPLLQRGWASLIQWHPNMFLLIALGVVSSYIYSVVAVLAPGLFPLSFQMHGGVATYFDTAAVVTVLVLLGQVLELRARQQTGTAIRLLLGLAPKTARVIRANGKRTFLSRKFRLGICCVSGPAKKSPSTAK